MVFLFVLGRVRFGPVASSVRMPMHDRSKTVVTAVPNGAVAELRSAVGIIIIIGILSLPDGNG